MLDILFNTLPIFLAITITLWYRSKGKLPANFVQVTSFIAFQIVVPVLLFQILSRAEFNRDSLYLVIFSLLLVVVLLLNGWVLSRFFGKNRAQKGVLHFSQLDFYVYGFGMPFILANFANDVVGRIVLMDIVVFLCYLFVGGVIASRYSSKSAHLKATITDNTLKSLFFWTIVVSLAVNLLNLPIPDKVYSLSNYFSQSFGLLVALLIGASVTFPKLGAIKAVLVAYFSRIAVVSMLILGASTVFAFSNMDQAAMWLTFTVPFGSFGILFATKYQNDKDFMAQLHLTSFFLAFMMYPLLIWWLKS